MGVPKNDAPLEPTVKKHVALVHVAGELGLIERKLINVLLLGAYDELLTRRVHEISQEALCQLIGFNSHNYDHLRAALAALTKITVEFNQIDGSKLRHRWGTGAILSWAELSGGSCSYSFVEQMAERLYDPEVYSRINVITQNKFRSSFSLALYENCLRFRRVGSTGFWDVDKVRRLLGATAPLYDPFWRLKQRVIEPAVKEVSGVSEILVKPEYQRASTRGSPVVAVRFLVSDNPQSTMFPLIEDADAPARETEGYKRLRDLGLSDRLALATANSDPAFALRVALHVERKHKEGGIKKSRAAYASKLIEVRAELGDVPTLPAASRIVERPSQANAAPDADRASRLRAFQDHRNDLAARKVSASQRLELLRQYADQKSAEGVRLRTYNPEDGTIKGIEARAFGAYLTEQVLGPYTEADFLSWAQHEKNRGR